MELRQYQVEAKDAILKEWEDKQRTLLVLPTGCGKTVVFADVAKDRARIGRVLILAHREELLTQASDKISPVLWVVSQILCKSPIRAERGMY